MASFEYNGNPSRVIFGSGTLSMLAAELARLEVCTPLFLSTPEQQGPTLELAKSLGARADHLFAEATMHTPLHITEKALGVANTCGVDSFVSLGGGSTIGLGKALSVRTGLVHICIPTTYAGSEMTPILGETVNGLKTTRRDPAILPTTVIYDVDLTLTLPAMMSATSGINAIAHAVEALYAANKNPIVSVLALEGIRPLARSLPTLVSSPSDISARKDALFGAWLCGFCLGSVDMALHHKLCHTLGGSFNLPHAETHTIILPHALAYNAPAIPEAMQKLAEVLPDSDGDAIKGLNVLLERLGVRTALKDFGLTEEDVTKAAEIALSKPYPNPRTLEMASIQELIRRAWVGEKARADL
ncbi:putative maleylacetate reductase [Mytilinidion resinicola]|uniref:Maleylacetate reductase n=1 Tax=Mytilinidion resinicola TaxID=574789 RepID=A0A6A6YKK5_9PEZI|nr:putative maleylacetate reductase [Mytilinidion resinicola]KAF2809396.1 putative maleylacetate reductase [Mytilinidion resinicola]